MKTKMKFSYYTLRTTIRSLRKERNKTQEVASGLAVMSRTHWTMIESGAIKPSIDTLSRMAYALDMTLTELMAEVEKNYKPGDEKKE